MIKCSRGLLAQGQHKTIRYYTIIYSIVLLALRDFTAIERYQVQTLCQESNILNGFPRSGASLSTVSYSPKRNLGRKKENGNAIDAFN